MSITSTAERRRNYLIGTVTLAMLAIASLVRAEQSIEANRVIEIELRSSQTYTNPFLEVELNAVVRRPDGKQLKVPAFWDGGGKWCFRYASEELGEHKYQMECSDAKNRALNGVEGAIRVVASTSDNALYRHGPIRIGADHRHFEHVDGTPFFWLGDTWWKDLCKRMTWEGFQELTADRKAKGFTLVQIVCGPYPDEGLFEERWENEGGKPYEDRQFTRLNPKYFDYADRRIKHLVDSGIVPAIVGGWGRGDCDGMAMAGIEGMKRHWRNLIAHYGAYPTVWIVGGESGGPLWTEVAKYIGQTDSFHRMRTVHPIQSGRTSMTDQSAIDVDMLQTGHGGWDRARAAIPQIQTAYALEPAMPVVLGEYCYEGHMQTGFPDQQRYVFWGAMLNGVAGLTYGAAGIWHGSVEGDPGLGVGHVYDFTTWKEGMNFPGSTQLGYGKKFLESYPWWKIKPHPEWTDTNGFAAGIPGELRFIYLAKRGIYDWRGPIVKNLEADVKYHAFYFDPARAVRHEVGTVVNVGPTPVPFLSHKKPIVFEDHFEAANAAKWKDQGTPTRIENNRLVGGVDMLTTLESFNEKDAMVSVDANSDAEAAIVLRYHDPDNYVVALYTPSLKCMYVHDRREGNWGAPLGRVEVPKLGPNIHLVAATCGEYAAMLVTDGTESYHTPIIQIANNKPGKVGMWHYHVGDRQAFDNFEVSNTGFLPGDLLLGDGPRRVALGGEFDASPAPSPQDWVLVLERMKQ